MSFARSIPNILTGARIVLGIAVFGLLAVAATQARAAGGLHGALILTGFAAFVVGSATDFFDGWLARRLNAQSAWGAILDPIADKIAVVAVLLGLMWLEPRFGIAVPGFLILFREMFVSGLRETGASRGLKFPVTQLAKWKTTVQLIAFSIEILAAARPQTPVLQTIADNLLWLAAALTLWTGAQYAAAAQRQLGG